MEWNSFLRNVTDRLKVLTRQCLPNMINWRIHVSCSVHCKWFILNSIYMVMSPNCCAHKLRGTARRHSISSCVSSRRALTQPFDSTWPPVLLSTFAGCTILVCGSLRVSDRQRGQTSLLDVSVGVVETVMKAQTQQTWSDCRAKMLLFSSFSEELLFRLPRNSDTYVTFFAILDWWRGSRLINRFVAAMIVHLNERRWLARSLNNTTLSFSFHPWAQLTVSPRQGSVSPAKIESE